ncbi:MAG: hypothetical protein QXJ74_08630 [Nitrososphaera sp.]
MGVLDRLRDILNGVPRYENVDAWQVSDKELRKYLPDEDLR